MKCPRTCGELAQRRSAGIEVDICPECRGLWLDAGEFDPLVADRFAGEPLEAFFALTAEAAPPHRSAKCPVDGKPMALVRFDDLELDWCEHCHGIWIDGYERDALAETGSARAPVESTDAGSTAEQTEAVHVDDSAPEARLPGMVEIEPEGPLEVSLELDYSVTERSEAATVGCASCGAEVQRDRAMRRMDAHWCEACVIKGDFPGSNGPPVSQRMAEAAMAMSKAQVRLADKKDSIKQMKRKREVLRRGINRHNDMHVAHAVHATAKAVWNMFRRDDD